MHRNAITPVNRRASCFWTLLREQRFAALWNVGRARRKDRYKWGEGSYEVLFHCRALLAFQQATYFSCPQEIKMHPVVNTGRKEWLLGTAGLVPSSGVMLHLVIQSVVLNWTPTWSTPRKTAVCGDTSTSVLFLFLALALHPHWWSTSTAPVGPLSVRLGESCPQPHTHAQWGSLSGYC